MNNLVINKIFKRDPTRTLSLRKRFVADMNRRFSLIQKLIYQSIVENDAFGLLDDNVIPFPKTTVIRTFAAATKGQFDFPTDEGKVAAFMIWLREQTDQEILMVTRREGREIVGREAWMNVYIDSSYKQGILRAQIEMSKLGIVPSQLVTPQTPLGISFFSPIHSDRVGLIYTRSFEELKTVTQVMNSRIQGIITEGLTTGLARGIAEGKNPTVIARELVKAINSDGVENIGKVRARMIARTEIIRAHHVANINEYREAGIEGVTVLAEWGTAGTGVCKRCQEKERQSPYTLDEIEPLIPLHPNCRCVAIPYLPEYEKRRNKRR